MKTGARLTGIVCVSPDCSTESCGWVSADDAPELRHDADDRVWLCEDCIARFWPTVRRGSKSQLPGQTTLNLGGES